MRFRLFLKFALVLAADQAVKWAILHLLPAEGVFLVPQLLGLEKFLNPGIAFSIPFPGLISTILTVSLGVAFTFWGLWKQQLPAILIGAGGVSNAIDRALLGVTVDYLKIGPWSYLNLADLAIVAGLAFFLFRPTMTAPKHS